MAVAVLICGSEFWAMNEADRRAVEATEMKFYDMLLVYRKDQVSNHNIRMKLKVFILNDKI
jgi:hypothetical protein